MEFGIRHWNARHLLAAWSVYWIALAAAGSRALVRFYDFKLGAPRGHAAVRLDFEGGTINLVAMLDHRDVFGTSISPLLAALLIAGPPLLLWALWVIRRPRRDALADAGSDRAPLLPAQRWTPTAYHDALRREDLRERQEP